MEQIYMTLLIELAKAFLSIENAPNAHPRLKAALKAAMAESLKPAPPLAEPEASVKPINLKEPASGTGSSH